jgi:glycosyltransferase involved in cell wall biosynthesis
MLRRCLESLRAQELNAGCLRMTLILVDNNPEPTARPIYDAVWQGRDGRFVHCPRPGIPAARNAALEAALGGDPDYVAFVDDDEIAPPPWLGSLLQVLQDLGADAVEGRVLALPANRQEVASWRPKPTAQLRWEPYESLATSNVLFKARLARPPLSLRFDEAMQYTGGSDREFFMRAHKRGAKLARVQGVEVFEDVHAARQSLSYRASRAYAAGSNYFLRISKNEPPPVAALRIGARTVARIGRGLARLAFSGALWLTLQPRSAHRQWRKACLALCFAAGCITPLAGVRAYPYRNIHGT